MKRFRESTEVIISLDELKSLRDNEALCIFFEQLIGEKMACIIIGKVHDGSKKQKQSSIYHWERKNER